MRKGYFVTGTDTGIGKTTVTQILMRNVKEKRVAGMKPIASGCIVTSEGLRNEDAMFLSNAATIKLPYEKINPYAFEPPISPHIAAAQKGVQIDIKHILECYQYISNRAECVFVEGVGGWMAPINEQQTMADVAAALNISIILVVGMKLGCLNHALLTVSQIEQQGLTLAGWIANLVDPDMLCQTENLEYLTTALCAPLLGTIPYTSDPSALTSKFTL